MNICLKSNFYFKNFKIYFDMILSYYFFYPSITYKIWTHYFDIFFLTCFNNHEIFFLIVIPVKKMLSLKYSIDMWIREMNLNLRNIYLCLF